MLAARVAELEDGQERLARALAKLNRVEMFADMGEGEPAGLWVLWDEVAFVLHENTGRAALREPEGAQGL